MRAAIPGRAVIAFSLACFQGHGDDLVLKGRDRCAQKDVAVGVDAHHRARVVGHDVVQALGGGPHGIIEQDIDVVIVCPGAVDLFPVLLLPVDGLGTERWGQFCGPRAGTRRVGCQQEVDVVQAVEQSEFGKVIVVADNDPKPQIAHVKRSDAVAGPKVAVLVARQIDLALQAQVLPAVVDDLAVVDDAAIQLCDPHTDAEVVLDGQTAHSLAQRTIGHWLGIVNHRLVAAVPGKHQLWEEQEPRVIGVCGAAGLANAFEIPLGVDQDRAQGSNGDRHVLHDVSPSLPW